VLAAVRARLPAPLLVRPPSIASSPPTSLWSSGWAIVTFAPLVSTSAPPLRTLARVMPSRKVAVLAVGLSVPPLKLKMPCAAALVVVLLIRGTVRAPPLRL
jgi:hypothetical protein